MPVIQFLRGYGPYNTHETAGFSDEDARRLVEDDGMARYVGAAPQPAQVHVEEETEVTPEEAGEPLPDDLAGVDKLRAHGYDSIGKIIDLSYQDLMGMGAGLSAVESSEINRFLKAYREALEG